MISKPTKQMRVWTTTHDRWWKEIDALNVGKKRDERITLVEYVDTLRKPKKGV